MIVEERLKNARELIDKGDEFRILTHYDVDGICAGGIIAHYLLKNEKRFHISFFRNMDKEEILDIISKEDYVIMSDMGSSLIDSLEGNVIVLDHHKPPGDNEKILHINPHLDGYNGAHDACGSTLAYMLTREKEMVPFFLAGVFGDKQHLGGLTGLNKELFDELSLELKKELVLHGNIVNAILYSTEPFFPGLSGKQDEIERMLRDLGIQPTKEIEKLSKEEKTKLVSMLSLNLIKNSKLPEAGRFVFDFDVNFGTSIRYLTELIDSSARTDNQSVALAYILGDESAKERMELLRREYKSKVIDGLYKMLDNLFEMEHLQYFFADDSYLSSSLATVGSLYLLNPRKATVGIFVDDMVHISARGSRYLVPKVHLGDIMREAASKFGGNGGGHDIAAGATIPKGTEEDFLKEVDMLIGKSLSQ